VAKKENVKKPKKHEIPPFRADRTLHVKFGSPSFPKKRMTLGVACSELEAHEAEVMFTGQRHECILRADKAAKQDGGPGRGQGRMFDTATSTIHCIADVMSYTSHGTYITFTLKMPLDACTPNELVAMRDQEGSLELRHLGQAQAEAGEECDDGTQPLPFPDEERETA
jgi:hypothetical protein